MVRSFWGMQASWGQTVQYIVRTPGIWRCAYKELHFVQLAEAILRHKWHPRFRYPCTIFRKRSRAVMRCLKLPACARLSDEAPRLEDLWSLVFNYFSIFARM